MDTPNLFSTIGECHDYATWLCNEHAADYADMERLKDGAHRDTVAERLMTQLADRIGHPSAASAVICTATIEEYAIACSMCFNAGAIMKGEPGEPVVIDSSGLGELIKNHKDAPLGVYLMSTAAAIIIQRLEDNYKNPETNQ